MATPPKPNREDFFLVNNELITYVDADPLEWLDVVKQNDLEMVKISVVNHRPRYYWRPKNERNDSE